MQVKLSKPVFGTLEIPDNLDLGAYGPSDVSGAGMSDTEIRRAVASPLGTPPLRQMARGKRNVLVVTDDNTRATPLSRILPAVIAELEEGGVRPGDITILIGLGTHRPMTAAEIETKFGRSLSYRFRILNHGWNDSTELVSLGECDLGYEVVINRRVLAADLLISIGSIVPHATAGFSGGGKTIMPGVCGETTLESIHWRALDFPMAGILGREENPVLQAIVSVARKAGLAFIVNAVMADADHVYGVFAGDLETAHRRGIEDCRRVYGVPVPRRAGIVIAEAYPSDIDLRQSIKAICAADLVCRDGGVVILPAECREGAAPQFPNFAQIGFSDPEGLYQRVQDGRFKQKLLAYTLVAIGRIISRRIKAILISPSFTTKEAEAMGFIGASNMEDALWKARMIVGADAEILTLLRAGEILPLLPPREQS